MPGVIQASTSYGTMPYFLCELFSQQREYLLNLNDYKDATSQREVIVFNSRRRWTLRPKAIASAMVTLRNFYISRKGPTQPFYFYDFTESTPMGNYDGTGVDPNGRFLVRFEGKWEQIKTVSQAGTASIQLVELIEGLGAGEGGTYDFSVSASFMFGL